MTTAKIFKPGTQQSLIERAKKTPPLKLGKYEMRIEPDDFDDFYAEKARKELNETPETVKHGLEELRKLLRGNKISIFKTSEKFFVLKKAFSLKIILFDKNYILTRNTF